jgi:hypothetical protein
MNKTARPAISRRSMRLETSLLNVRYYHHCRRSLASLKVPR